MTSHTSSHPTPGTGRRRTGLRAGLVAVAAAAALALTGCGGGTASSDSASASGSDSGNWPLTIEHVKGTTTLDKQPERIVSTSPTLTGTLLAIDAPVVSSAATTVSDITDSEGFFSQWGDVAKERGVQKLYPDLKFDEEAVIAADPDLIVVAATGADSTVDQYDKLSKIAPTIVVDYGKQSWQSLAEELGKDTGHEDGAKAAEAKFSDRVSEVKSAVSSKAGDANVIVWNGQAGTTAFAKPGSAHADLLESVGFSVKGADDSMDTSEQKRSDFTFVSLENAVKAMQAPTVFVANGDDATVKDLKGTKVMASNPAVKDGDIVALGNDSFRIDYYSGLNILQKVQDALS